MKRILTSTLCLLITLSMKAQESTLVTRTATSSSAIELAVLPDAPQSTTDVHGQDPSPGSTPSVTTQSSPAPHQTKRILGVVPNFRAVNANTTLPPQSAREKFKTAFQDSFDYSSFIFEGAQAGVSQATKSYPAFGQGAAGYGRYYWHTFADQADENLWVEFILATALHQDNRYYTLGHGGILRRTGYAISRVAITRSDSGGRTVNVSEIVGAGAASGISTAYYPDQYATWTKTGQRWLTSVILDSATFAAKEFWPDINRAIFHQQD